MESSHSDASTGENKTAVPRWHGHCSGRKPARVRNIHHCAPWVDRRSKHSYCQITSLSGNAATADTGCVASTMAMCPCAGVTVSGVVPLLFEWTTECVRCAFLFFFCITVHTHKPIYMTRKPSQRALILKPCKIKCFKRLLATNTWLKPGPARTPPV